MINEINQFRYVCIGYLLFSLLYLGAPYLSWQAALPAPAIWTDSFIPFLPSAIWGYFSQFVLLFCSIWHAPDNKKRTITFYSILLTTVLAALIFIFFPTELPRYEIEGTGITAFLWHCLYATDVSTNCFPSLHAALSVIAGYSLFQKNLFFKICAPLWVSGVIFAALTTKQHVIMDIFGGIALALISRGIVIQYFKSYLHV